MTATLLEFAQPGAASAALLFLILAYPILRAIYNIYFHPLRNIPGPKLWAATRLPYIWALLRGTIVHDIQKLHRKYGPILRVGPDELTFTNPSVWNDILQAQPGKPEFLKDPTWWSRQPDQADSFITTVDPEQHARMRKALSPGFTTRGLRAQETHIQRYVNLLVKRLSDIINSSTDKCPPSGPGAEIDIGPWFNFATFDIFGDLAFGESFDCLQNSQYHPWVDILFSAAPKASSWIASARYYPWLYSLLFRGSCRDGYQMLVGWLRESDYRERRGCRSKLIPFSIGSRACIGQHLVWAEMRLILTKLLRAFDFEEVEGKRLAWESLRTFLLVEKKPVSYQYNLPCSYQDGILVLSYKIGANATCKGQQLCKLHPALLSLQLNSGEEIR
ncbi:cytochrome P450 [Apiosordaria backusii]|uniref:Cytochrome P450 n=1 Tax=Apiosordaria backusii TaxID=314023 RepID=A0AA40ANB2_9PEZI|nr:cytochrome P450 [Apiosordaria backusii]